MSPNVPYYSVTKWDKSRTYRDNPQDEPQFTKKLILKIKFRKNLSQSLPQSEIPGCDKSDMSDK